MNRGNNRFILEVVPDSGTGDMTGLSGKMAVHIEDDERSYDFDYDSDTQMEGFLHNRHPN